MNIIEITKKMAAEGMTTITNPAHLKTELSKLNEEEIKKMRSENGQLVPAAQQEMSLRGDRIAFIEFHRYIYDLSDVEIAELKQAMKQFYYKEKLGESEYIYCDQSLLEDAIDYQFCLRGSSNFSPGICEEIAISFKNNIKLALQYSEIDSKHLIAFAKRLINKHREQERRKQMENSEFEHNMMGAKTLSEHSINLNDADFWAGYQRGMRRFYHSEKFGTAEEHELWLSAADEKADEQRRYRGIGYRAGFLGMPISDAIKKLQEK